MENKQTYRVTRRAGEWVAGQPRPADGVITLTPRQAAYEIILGTIEPVQPVRLRRRSRSK